MPNLLDLNLLAVARYAGQYHPELLGLRASESPRRAARGREPDRSILYLVISGNAPLSPAKQDQVLADLSKLYYDTPGSITSAMRKVAEELNRLLLERNLRLASSSRQGLGLFIQVVVRGQKMYLAQSGPTHAFLITAKDVQHFHDVEMVEQGLGQSRVTPLSFSQATLEPNDTLIIAAYPSPEWGMDTLRGFHGQGPESLRRRLLNQPTIDLNAVLIQAKPGKGNSYFYQLPATQVEKPVSEQSKESRVRGEQGIQDHPSVQPEQAGPIAETSLIQPEETTPVEADDRPGSQVFLSRLPSQTGVLPTPEITAITAEQPIVGRVSQLDKDSEALTETSMPVPSTFPAKLSVEKHLQPFPSPQKSNLEPIWKVFIAIGTPLVKIWQKIANGLRMLLGRILPGEPFITVPSSAMVFIALAVPAIIVTVASVTYFRIGRAAQYEILYSQAERMAVQAIDQTDLLTKRAELEATVDILQRVEFYQITPETQALRIQVRRALDELDLVRRVDYKTALIGGLPVTVNITRIVFAYNDLYLLDSNGGSVIHAMSTDQGYIVDQTFQCGSGASGGGLIGTIVEIAAWPVGYEPEASLVALDAAGNLLFCSTDGSPIQEKLTAPSSESWGKIAAFTLDLGDFYVLDLLSNGVWIYWRSDVKVVPTMYFDQDIPVLQDVVDLEVNRSDLYLLHEDGSLTLCFLGTDEVFPTRCSEESYIDFRAGRENLALVPTAPFTQIVASPPPDPSLFLLEPISHAIYHFSLRNLAFQRQYLPENPLPSRDATAFAVDTIHRNLFLAIGNEVYYAVMP